MRMCWPTWSAPTATITAPWPATASWPRRSRSWPGLIKAWCGPAAPSQPAPLHACASTIPAALVAWDDLGPDDPGRAWRRAHPTLGADPVPLADRLGHLRRGGRQRRIEERAAEIQAALRAEQLAAPAIIGEAMGATVAALVAVIAELNTQIARLEQELAEGFEQHPDAKIVRSLPGLGTSSAPGCSASSGTTRTATPMLSLARTTPAHHHHQSLGQETVVLARYARNRRLADACYLWAFCRHHRQPRRPRLLRPRRAAGDTHHQALRALGNRLVGILHGCLATRALRRAHRLGPPAEQRKRLDKLGPWDV